MAINNNPDLPQRLIEDLSQLRKEIQEPFNQLISHHLNRKSKKRPLTNLEEHNHRITTAYREIKAIITTGMASTRVEAPSLISGHQAPGSLAKEYDALFALCI